MSRIIAAALGILLLASAAHALTQHELSSLTEAVKEMCAFPDRTGHYLLVEGDAKAGLPVAVRIVKADLSGKLTYGDWKGIPIALDKYKTDPRACANEMLKILVPAFGTQKEQSNSYRESQPPSSNTMNASTKRVSYVLRPGKLIRTEDDNTVSLHEIREIPNGLSAAISVNGGTRRVQHVGSRIRMKGDKQQECFFDVVALEGRTRVPESQQATLDYVCRGRT